MLYGQGGVFSRQILPVLEGIEWNVSEAQGSDALGDGKDQRAMRNIRKIVCFHDQIQVRVKHCGPWIHTFQFVNNARSAQLRLAEPVSCAENVMRHSRYQHLNPFGVVFAEKGEGSVKNHVEYAGSVSLRVQVSVHWCSPWRLRLRFQRAPKLWNPAQ